MDYISARNREMQTTLKVLQAYPEAKVNLKPAEKSRTAAELAMIFAVEERVAVRNRRNEPRFPEAHHPIDHSRDYRGFSTGHRGK
jgi:hypothetical protein